MTAKSWKNTLKSCSEILPFFALLPWAAQKAKTEELMFLIDQLYIKLEFGHTKPQTENDSLQFDKIKLCIFKSNEYNMLWASAHSFSCNCFKFSPISQAVVLGLNFNGFPLWHLKEVHRGGNSSLLLLTYDNFPLGTIHKIHLITPAEAKIICDKNAPVVDIVMSKTSMSWKSIWIYLKSQIELWNLKIYFKYGPCGVVPCVLGQTIGPL